MPDSDQWISYKDLADELHVELERLYSAVSALRRTGGVETKPDPMNESKKLINRSGITSIKRYLRID